MTPSTMQEWYQEQFRTFERGLNGGAAGTVHALRRQGLASFRQTGFPTAALEEWRFTNVAPIASTPFLSRDGATTIDPRLAAPFFLPDPHAVRLTFVNGRYAPELSHLPPLPAGAVAAGLAGLLGKAGDGVDAHLARLVGHDDNGFSALNAAFLRDGAFIKVPEGVTIDAPIHLLFLATGEREPLLITPRILVVAGARSRLSLVETYASPGEGQYLTNAVSEIFAGEGAVIEHDTLQLESPRAYHVKTTAVRQAASSRVTSNAISLGGAIVRNTVRVTLGGAGGDCTLNGLSLATGGQLVDNHTEIDHAHAECASHELYKAILDGHARGVFNGKIVVREGAQKTDARQTNKTLLLSDDATIDTKPQLEIFADDVKCTHGATVGQLDDDQVFYLRARGIGEIEARDLLTFAFATDVINRVHVDALRLQLEALVHGRLHEGRLAEEHRS